MIQNKQRSKLQEVMVKSACNRDHLSPTCTIKRDILMQNGFIRTETRFMTSVEEFCAYMQGVKLKDCISTMYECFLLALKVLNSLIFDYESMKKKSPKIALKVMHCAT